MTFFINSVCQQGEGLKLIVGFSYEANTQLKIGRISISQRFLKHTQTARRLSTIFHIMKAELSQVVIILAVFVVREVLYVLNSNGNKNEI